MANNNYVHTGSESPYNDDFESIKNYKRVLFKPSTAVQARELTQMQTALQWQLASLGSYLFKDGTPITGAKITYSINQPIMRYQSHDSNGQSINGDALVGLKFIGSDSNQLIQVTEHIPGTNYILFSYFGTTLNDGEGFESTAVDAGHNSQSFQMVSGSVSNCVTAVCSEGVLFIDGYFVEVPAAHIVVDTGYNNAEIYNIGFNINRSIISATLDSSLNDNASGSTNFNAPGADRYKIAPTLVSYKQSEYDSLDADFKSNFVSGIVMQNDIVLKEQAGVNNTELMDLLAKRTYDESGSYTVEDWKILLEDYRATEAGNYSNLYTIAIQPGSGYIQGYHVKNLITEYVGNVKPRTSVTKNESSIYVPTGTYTLAKFDEDDGVSGFGFPSFTGGSGKMDTVALMSGEDGEGTVLGTCNIYGFQRLNNNFYIYLINTENVRGVFASGKSLASCTIDSTTGEVTVTADSTSPSGTSYALNLYQNENGNSVLYGQESSNIHRLNSSVTKSAGAIKYSYICSFSAQASASGSVLQLTAGETVQFPSASSLITVIQNSGTGAGNHLDINKITVVPNGNTCTLSSSLFSASESYTAVFAITSTNVTYRTKVATEVTINITIPSSETPSDICYLIDTVDTSVYRFEDVEKIKYVRQTNNFNASITESLETTTDTNQPYYDITNLVTLNRNQTDYTYENSYLEGFASSSVLGARGTGASTTYQVKFVYYAHVGSIGPFTVQSYLKTDTNANNEFTELYTSTNYNVLVGNGYYEDLYSAIPSYRDKNNNLYDLKDCLDFRVKRSFLTDGVYINGAVGTSEAPRIPLPAPDSLITYRQSIFLPRYDVVYVTKDGSFGVKNGIPSENPQVPSIVEGALGICTILNKAYMGKLSEGMINYYDTKRYTMADIGQINSKIERAENLLSMTLLEQNTINMNVPDENGLDRYKSGIFAEDFSNFNNSDYSNELFDCTLDNEDNCLRPQFEADNIPFVVSQSDLNSSTASLYIASDGISGMVPYTTTIYAQNLHASETINLESMMFVTWDGNLKLTPSVDTWVNDLGNKPIKEKYVETPKPPTQYRYWKTTYGKFQYVTHHGNTDAGWAAWRASGTGREEYMTHEVSKVYEAVQDGWTLQDEIVKKNVVVDQYMRQRSVKFEITGMRPNVALSAKIDNYPLTITANGSTGPTVLVGSDGKCSGTFTIPKNVPCGQKVVVFKDAEGYANAEAKYTANGTTIWNDVNRTYLRNWTFKDTGKTKITRSYDPVAESFTVDTEEGIYLDSIDIYVAKKDDSLPIGLHIVQCENGFPTENEVELSDVLIPAANVTTGLNNPTNFKFDQPIFLQSGVEYAFVVWSASYEYEIYTSTLGQKDLSTGIGIAEQPFLGCLFTSQNRRTWSAEQMRDIKFRIHKCVFDTSASYSNVFDLDVTQSESYANDPNTDFVPDYMCLVSNDFSPNNTSIKYEYMWGDDEDWTEFINHEEIFLKQTKTIQVSDTTRVSLKVRATLSTSDENLTPVLDLEQMYGIFTSNNTTPCDQQAFLYNCGTYISRTVELENTANDLRVILDVKRAGTSDIDVYFKTSSYKPVYVEKTPMTDSSSNPFKCADPVGAISNIGNEMQVYYYVASQNKLYPRSQCVISGYREDSTTSNDVTTYQYKTFLNQIGNPEDFCGLNSSGIYQNASGNELKVNTSGEVVTDGTGANVTDIFILNEYNTPNTPITITNLDTSVSTTINAGTYVFFNNYIWKAVSQANSNTNVPSEISSVWKKISGVRVVTPITTDESEVEWRPMKKQTSGAGTSVDNSESYIEETYIPQIDLETEFTQFSVRIDLKCNLKYDVPTVKNLRAIAVI